ncbi:MAG: glycosyltransferase family 39 protein [Chitinophagaceae bacterium]
MEPDAAVYAETSMEMYDSGNFLNITHKGKDWLDKPHFPFWITAISYKIFGVGTVSYKLPAILFTLLAALYTFLFTARFYTKKHAFVAVLILITTLHVIISNQDVRAEPFMMGLTIMSMYHFAVYLQSKNFLQLILGCVALACLIMTKGPFTIIPTLAGIGGSLLYNKKWKEIFHWQWIVAGLITFLFLSPSLYAYYLQFDRHPEKVIFGKTNVSGVEFFLWTSQWGRFTNTGPIKGSGDIFYFFHTLLWAFLPWALLAYYALYSKTKKLIKKTNLDENYTYFGFIILFLIFSASGFQLSFYLNPIFPFLAILTTAFIFSIKKNNRLLKIFSTIHFGLCIFLVIAICVLHYFFSGNFLNIDTIIVLVSGISAGLYLFIKKNILKKIVFATPLIVLSVNYYLNRDFYPALLKYQSESEVAYYVDKHKIPPDQFVFLGNNSAVLDVILHHVTPLYSFEDVQPLQLAGKYVFTGEEGLKIIDKLGLKHTVITTFEDFPVTRITGEFINRSTRSKAVKKNLLVKVLPSL